MLEKESEFQAVFCLPCLFRYFVVDQMEPEIMS